MANFDINKYRSMFLEEAQDLFSSLEQILLEAESSGSLDDQTMQELFRDMHTLKGGAASVEYVDFTRFTHELETFLDRLRNHEFAYRPEMADFFLQSLDVMKELMLLESDGAVTPQQYDDITAASLERLQEFVAHTETTPAQNEAFGFFTEPEPQAPSAEAEGGGFGFFDDPEPAESGKKEAFGFFEQAEAPEVAKPTAASAPATPTETGKERVAKKSSMSNTIRVDLGKIENLMNNIGELVIATSMISQFVDSLTDMKLKNSFIEKMDLLERHIRELQESVMSTRMVPMEDIYAKFPKMIRDTAKKLDKNVEFNHFGDSVEIDKAMIEGLTDPLMHIIRNAIDHGIESPEVRVAEGKTEHGTLMIGAEHANGQIIISIADDGKGIDVDRVANKAVERGILSSEQLAVLGHNEKAELIFHPGLSTAEKITDVSGRGVGMDVVKNNITKLGGAVGIKTEAGKGTTITIVLPLTLAILDGLNVTIGDMTVILPLASIVESLQPTAGMIKTVGDGSEELLMLREEFIPVVRLHRYMNIPPKNDTLTEGMLIVVRGGNHKVALFVDEFRNQQQVVVKPLDKNFHNIQGVGGATVRGDGTIGLILDVLGIVDRFKYMGSEAAA